MFREVLLLATAFVALAACTTKAPDTSADEATLKANAPVWFDLYKKGDADGVANLYAEDGIVMAPGASAVVGRAAIRDFIAADIENSKAAGLGFESGEFTGVGVAGDLAWLSGTFSVTDATGATVDNGKYLSVYRRMNAEWKLIRDTWNSDKAPAPAASATPQAPAEAAPPAK